MNDTAPEFDAPVRAIHLALCYVRLQGEFNVIHVNEQLFVGPASRAGLTAVQVNHGSDSRVVRFEILGPLDSATIRPARLAGPAAYHPA